MMKEDNASIEKKKEKLVALYASRKNSKRPGGRSTSEEKQKFGELVAKQSSGSKPAPRPTGLVSRGSSIVPKRRTVPSRPSLRSRVVSRVTRRY